MKYPNIEAERARLGLTKDEFARKLGIATKTYYNWLNGANPIPSDALVAMSDMCNSEIDYLLGRTDEKGNEMQISEIRKDVNEKLKKEFDALHEVIVTTDWRAEKGKEDILRNLIRCQIDLTVQIVREERALHGDNTYLMPPYRPK